MNTVKAILFYDSREGRGKGLVPALHWLLNLLCLGLWCLGVGVVSLWFGKVNYGPELFQSYFQYTGLFLLNILPVFVLAGLIWLLTNRVWPAVFFSGLITTVLALINHFKLLFRNDPLLATDVTYAGEAAQISARYNVRITPVIAAVFAAIVLASLFAFFFLKARFRRGRSRVILLLLLLALSAGAYLGAYRSDAVYDFTNNLGVEFADGFKMNQWNETDQYCCRGFLYPLVRSCGDLRSEKPAGYSKKAAEACFARYEDADIPDGQKINLVSVMLEAYCDFSVYGDVFPFETDPYTFYHQLESEGVSGELVTNIFAGGTIDTERCYVTGSTRLYEYRGAADSFARYFAAQGYDTEFCHPGYGWFYNRQNVMEYLGFARGHYFEDRYQTGEGVGILRDDAFLPDLHTLFDEAEKPYFHFSVTYQNHGPYASGYLYDTEREYIPRGSLSEESYHILNNYFWGIKLTDDSLRDFIDGFRDSDEPVVVVLFGDHKPWLGDNSTVYAELGLDLSRSTEESFYTYYSTQYLIWANDAAKAALGRDFSGEGPSISPCFLMMELFDECGWTGDAYLQALRELYESGVDVVNESGRYRENGELVTALSEDAAEALQRVLYMEYDRMKEG